VQEEIVNVVKSEVENSGYKDRLFAGLVLTGGGANLRNIKELCQFSLQLPTRIGVPDNSFAHNLPTELKHPMFATALGLLKFGIAAEYKAAPQEAPEEEGKPKSSIFKRKKEPKAPKEPKKEKAPGTDIFSKIPSYLKDLLERIS
jgi:cell division protein FtsA